MSAQAKARLIEKLASATASRVAPPVRRPYADSIEGGPRLDVAELEAYREIRLIEEAADYLGIADPFFRVHEGIAGAETVIGGRTLIPISPPTTISASMATRASPGGGKAAIDRYGTSASASRLVSGERPIHRELERALARIHGAEDSIAFVGGHSTNVSVIGSSPWAAAI